MPTLQSKRTKSKPSRTKRTHNTKHRKTNDRLVLTWPNEVFVLTEHDIDPSVIIADEELPQSSWGHMNNQFKFSLEVKLSDIHKCMDLWVGAMANIKHKLYLPSTKGRLTYIRYTKRQQQAMLYNLTWCRLGYTEGQTEETQKIYNWIFPDN